MAKKYKTPKNSLGSTRQSLTRDNENARRETRTKERKLTTDEAQRYLDSAMAARRQVRAESEATKREKEDTSIYAGIRRNGIQPMTAGGEGRTAFDIIKERLVGPMTSRNRLTGMQDKSVMPRRDMPVVQQNAPAIRDSGSSGLQDYRNRLSSLAGGSSRNSRPAATVKNDATGRYGRGTIDLNNRTPVQNDDGTISTELSISINDKGKEVLIPTVIDGRIVSDDEAIQHYYDTDEYLGKFDTVEEADEYAERLHDRQDWYYNQGTQGINSGDQFATDDDASGYVNRIRADRGYAEEKGRNAKGAAQTLEPETAEAQRALMDKNAAGTAAPEEMNRITAEGVEREARNAKPGRVTGNAYGMGSDEDWRAMQQYAWRQGEANVDFTDKAAVNAYYAWGVRVGAMDDSRVLRNYSDEALTDIVEQCDAEIARIDTADTEAARERLESVRRVFNQGYQELLNYGYVDPETGKSHKQTGRPADYLDGPVRYYNGKLVSSAEYYDYTLWDQTHAETAAELLEQDPANAEMIHAEAAEMWHALIMPGDDLLMKMRDEKEQGWQAEIDELTLTLDPTQRSRLVSQKEKAQKILDQRARVAELEANVPGDGEYHPEKQLGLTYDDDPEALSSLTVSGSMADKIYFYANHPGGGVMDYNGYNLMTPYATEGHDYAGGELMTPTAGDMTDEGLAYYMTPEQLRTFNAYYNSGDYESAEAYFQGIKSSLMTARGRWAEEYYRSEASKEYGGLAGLSTILTQPLAALSGIAGTVMALFGDEDAADPNSGYYYLQKANNTIRATRAQVAEEKYGKAGSFFMNVMYSVADNLVSLGMAKFSGMGEKAASALVQLVMSGEATSAKMVESLEKGYDPTECVIRAVGAGVIEALTEKYSIEGYVSFKGLLSDPKALAKFIGGQMIAEGSEEVASDVCERIADKIISAMYGHEDEIEARIRELEAQNIPRAKAERMAILEWYEGLGEDFLSGALSAVPLGTLSAGANSYNNRQVGAAISSDANTTTEVRTTENGAEVVRSTGKEKLAKAGAGMKKDTQSYKLAKQIEGKLEKGQQVSNYEVGLLATTMAQESSEAVGKIARQTVTNMAADELRQNGVEEQEAGQYAELIAKAATEGAGSLTQRELNTLSRNKTAIDTLGSFLSMPGQMRQQAAVKEAASAELAAQESVRQLTQEGGEQKQLQKKAVVTEGVKTAAKSAAESYVADAATLKDAGERTGARDVVVDGGIGQIESRNADGTYQVKTADGSVRNVEAEDLQTAEGTLGTLVAYDHQNKGAIDGEGFRAILNGIDRNAGMDGESYVSEAMRVYLNARTMGTTGKTALGAESLAAIEKAAAADNAAQKQIRLNKGAKQAQVKPGQGKATIGGAQYGTKEFRAKVDQLYKEKKITQEQRTQIRGAAELAQRLGFNVDFVYQPEMDGTFGWESGATGQVTINLAGRDAEYTNPMTNEKISSSHHLMVAMSHELTHWLEQNSAEQYDALRKFVFDTIRKNGGSVENLLMKKISDYREVLQEDLNVEGAMAEIVADACDQVLGNERIVSELRKTDPGLFGKVQEFVRKIVARIRAAAQGMAGSMSKEAEYMLKDADELARIWLGARAEAMGRERTQAEAKGNERVNMEEAEREEAQYSARTETENDRSKRMTEEHNELIRLLRKADTNEINTKDDVVAYIGEEKYGEFRQWMHNTYDKGNKEKDADNISIEKLIDFINLDKRRIRRGSRSVIEGWKELEKDGSVKPINISEEKVTTEGGYQNRINEISRYLFGKKSGIFVGNDETEANIYVNKKTVKETIGKCNEKGIPGNVTEKVLRSTVKLLKTAKYIGSRSNYTHKGKYIHFYVNVAEDTVTEINEEGKEIKITYHDTVVFAVHDAVDSNAGFRRRAYVEDIELFNETKNEDAPEYQPRMKSDSSDAQQSGDPDSHPVTSSEYNIYDILDNVNTDKIRFFNKNRIKDRDYNIIQQTEDDLADAIEEPVRQFSMRTPVEARKDGLVAVHNLTYDNLMDTLAEGGFTAPSIAVIRAAMGHSKYGEISVLFNKDTIDPKKNRKNKIYGADAYTPTRYNAQVETELKYEDLMEVSKEISMMLKNEDPRYYHEAEWWFGERAYREVTTKTPGQMAEDGYGNEALMAAYLKRQGKEIPIKTKEVYKNQNFHADRIEAYQNLFNALYDSKMLHEFLDDVKHLSGKNLVDKYGETFAKTEKACRTMLNLIHEKNSDLAKKSMMNWIKQTAEFIQGGTEKVTETDWYATRNAMESMIDKGEFVSWLTGKLTPAFGRKGIRNNLDPYTPMGNSRTFSQLHKPYTVENVVKAMYENATQKGQGGRYASGVVATASKEYSNIQEVRDDSGRIRMETEEDYDKIIEGLNQKITRLANEIGGEGTYAADTFDYALIEAGRYYAKSQTMEAIRRGLAKEDIKVTDAQLKEIKALLDEAREIPTGYFEAKPERVVGLDEIERVILPENTYKALTDELDKRGISYETYDGTDEDRLRVLNSVENVQFSIRTPGSDLEVRTWMLGLNESGLETAQERTMLKQFKDANMALEMSRERIRQYTGEMRKLEAKESPTAFDRAEMTKTQNKLQIAWTRYERQQNEMSRILSDKGYAGMMFREAQRMNSLVGGKTLDQVKSMIGAIEMSTNRLNRFIDEREKVIREIADSQAARQIQTLMTGKRLDVMAKYLRTNYRSSMNKQQLMQELAGIKLKLEAGQDVESDVRDLAARLVERAQGAGSTYLELLKGTTIRLGPGQMAELKAQGSSLKEVRSILAGTGIKVAQAQGQKKGADLTGDGNGIGSYGALDSVWGELCDMIPALDRETSEKDQLGELLAFVEGEKRAASGEELYKNNMDDVEADVLAAAAAVEMNKPRDPAAMAILKRMNTLIGQMAGDMKKGAEAIAEIRSEMREMAREGRLAADMTADMKATIRDMIRYNNALTEQSEAVAWRKQRIQLIEQLKSEHTEKLVAEQEKWKAKIAKDRQARALQDEVMRLRRSVNTNIGRVRKLLVNETPQNNVPEHMKTIAREMIRLIVENDMVGRKISGIDPKDMPELMRLITEWEKQDGRWSPEDLNELGDDVGLKDALYNAIEDIRNGIFWYNRDTKGKDIIENLEGFKSAMQQVQNGVATITGVINAQRMIVQGNRKALVMEVAYKVQDQTGGRKHRELKGRGSRALTTLKRFIADGNITPEYFFKWLKNEGLDYLWEGYHQAENRNGLELQKAQKRLAEIAEKHGYAGWDTKQKITLDLEKGGRVDVTLGQLMSLWATWKRENTLGPAMSHHLVTGGFYAEQDMREGKPGRQEVSKKAHRVTAEDMIRIEGMLTDEQRAFVNDVVEYMSTDMSEMGNQASMDAYGIKMYKESYYFPMKMWDGIKSRKSNDAGNAANADRAFHPSFSKSRKHGAGNALMIGDFMTTAADHIVGMINYATIGLANENMQKVLNAQVPVGNDMMDMTQRNIRAVIEEAYGRDVSQYMENLKQQLNGGAVKTEKTIYDKAISLFRKNAVAGSLSVSLQQPLSYIRAAMMISPKHLAAALNPVYWKGSYAEMLAHSGVAVIKQMGRFDVALGQSAREYIQPEGLESRGRKIWNRTTELATALPEKMDNMTWTRMWSAVKVEQHQMHPEMDMKSDEFLDMVGERFNEVMRRTQVYDSVLVKSANMRSQNPIMKGVTSFMGEPTLTLNVLADAVKNADSKGGKLYLAKAAAVYLLSAAAQAAIKAVMSTGRTPDEDKTWLENFMNRFISNFISEADPANLVPGYSDMIELFKKGELKDDAMGTVGKIISAGKSMVGLITGGGKGAYRDIEDSAGQLIQLFSGLPLKNIMRDLRAGYNWFIEKPYADRPTSSAVIRQQAIAGFLNADNLIGVVNQYLGDAGFQVKNDAYYQRLYDAIKAGDEATAAEIREYLIAKGVEETTIDSKVAKLAKADTELTPEQQEAILSGSGYGKMSQWAMEKYRNGEIDRTEAERIYREQNPGKSDDEVWYAFDRADFERETGIRPASNDKTYRLIYAMDANKVDMMRTAIDGMLKHGAKKSSIRTSINNHYRDLYKAAGPDERIRIQDAMQKAYKILEYEASDATKVVNGWK